MGNKKAICNMNRRREEETKNMGMQGMGTFDYCLKKGFMNVQTEDSVRRVVVLFF